MKTLLLAFGNEYIKTDSLAIEISREISNEIEDDDNDNEETKNEIDDDEINNKIESRNISPNSNNAKNLLNAGINAKIDVKRCYSIDSLYDYQDYEKIFILDVVKGLEKTELITDIGRIKGHKLYSLHDFDLGFFLKLMKELGMLKEINIIGIPQQGDKEEIKKEIIHILNSINS